MGFFDRHVLKYLARYNIDILTSRKRYRKSPESFKVRVAREHIGDAPYRPCSDFAAHIHDVVDDILFLTSQTPLSTTTPVIHTRSSLLDEFALAYVHNNDKWFMFLCSWWEPDWEGFGHRSPRNTRLTTFVIAVVMDWDKAVEWLLDLTEPPPMARTPECFGRLARQAMTLRRPHVLRLCLSRGASLVFVHPLRSKQIKEIAIAGDLHIVSTLLDFAIHPTYQDFFWECVVVDSCAAFGEQKINEILMQLDWSKARHVRALIVRKAREDGYNLIVDSMVEGMHPVEVQEAEEKAVVDKVWPKVSQLYPDKVSVPYQARMRFRELKAAYGMVEPVGTDTSATCEEVYEQVLKLPSEKHFRRRGERLFGIM
ncbi:hypothetical protein SLS60_006504 [Paraconiothyrium brasiliense]|uniref:Uncharacterized protein n=1 Tax=Paraconiothyrium brasiliense TaxID=300254 RepID=A0ABR3RBU8_9PLEO